MINRRRGGPALLTKKAAPTVQTDFTVKIDEQDFPCSKEVLKEIVKNPDINLDSSDSVSLSIKFDESIKLQDNNKFKAAIKSILNGQPTFLYDKNLNILIDYLKINNLVTKEAENSNDDELKWLTDIDHFFGGESVDINKEEDLVCNVEKSIDDETIIWLLVGKVIADHKNAEKYVNIMLSYIQKRGASFENNLRRVVINSLKNAIENGTEVKMIFELIFIVRRLYEAKVLNEKDFDLNLGNRLLPATFIDIVKTTNRAPFKVFNNNFDALAENEFDIHKQLCHNGVNPDDIYQLIRSDNLKEFDSITSTTTNSDNAEDANAAFDYNKENYMKSAYERCTYVNNDFMCYVDISAFFGSVNIFKYLINDKKARLTSKTVHYAIASGNKEIIEICEKNNLSFDGTLTEAIQFHQFELFKWLVNDKKLSIDNCFDTLITTCLQFSSFKILKYLLDLPFEKPDLNIVINLMNVIEQSCKWGNFPVLRHVLKNVLITRPFQGDNINAFHMACQNGNPEIVKFLSQQSFVNKNCKVMTIIGSQGWSGLHFAASKGNTEAVRVLIECKDIEINCTTSKNQTAIHLACERSITDTIKILVEHPFSNLAVATNQTNLLALHISCQRGNSDAVGIILNSNKNYGGINALSAGDMTPLHLACISGSGETVKLLCAVPDIDLNIKDFEKHNALQLACIHNNIDCVKVLSNQPGIDLKAVCKFDLSFLNTNSSQENFSQTPGSPTPGQQPGAANSTPNTNNDNQPTNNQNGSFHFSCLNNSERRGSENFPFVGKFQISDNKVPLIPPTPSCPPDGVLPNLSEPGTDITERRPSIIDIDQEEEINVLFYAAISGHLRLFQVLVSNPGIDVNAVNNRSMSVLHICCQQGQIDFVRLLLFRNDLNINIKTNGGLTPLHLAAKEGHVDVVKALVSAKGIELNPTTNDDKLTPLHLACERGRAEVVKVLCATKGVDVSMKTGSGQTPVQIACQNGHSDVFAILSQKNDNGLRNLTHDGRKPQFGPQSLSPKGPGRIGFGPKIPGGNSPKKGGITFGPK
ncbi:hypothetical protein M9Y10_010017 [Tritrichomonas musculus]|uniref:DUF3447 domain-containing protein n=1 Tax=Tritrichomonas musculus TaxID=1915356 RepID=A0ABR2IQV6_9EUKA